MTEDDVDEIKSDISAFRPEKSVAVVVVGDISVLSVANCLVKTKWLRAGGLATPLRKAP